MRSCRRNINIEPLSVYLDYEVKVAGGLFYAGTSGLVDQQILVTETASSQPRDGANTVSFSALETYAAVIVIGAPIAQVIINQILNLIRVQPSQ